MKIVYIVYREDNTLIFESQVLEYLKLLERDHEVELILFRNHETFFKKAKVENKISNYIDKFLTLPSLPLFFKFQLDVNVLRLKIRLWTKSKTEEPTLIMCRGELSTYIAIKAFKNLKYKFIMYDNRGLPIEELEMRQKTNIIYKLNKKVKEKTILYSKDHCDVYSFVTNNLRNYLLKKYDYSEEKKYFIVPTLTSIQGIDIDLLNKLKNEINYIEKDFYVTYIGSVAAWQSIDRIFGVFIKIKDNIKNAKLIILTSGNVIIPETLSTEVRDSIIIKTVKYELVKYYLRLSNIGLVLRNNNIVNKVAAPTKISEYISFDVPILYDGEIGILDDLSNIYDNVGLIKIDNDEWLDKVMEVYGNNEKVGIMNIYKDYFDMGKNQQKFIENVKKMFDEKSWQL